MTTRDAICIGFGAATNDSIRQGNRKTEKFISESNSPTAHDNIHPDPAHSVGWFGVLAAAIVLRDTLHFV